MKKRILFLMLTLFLLAGTSQANTVTIKLENIYSAGIEVSSFQMEFLENGGFGFPFLYNEDDIFLDPDIEWNADFGSDSAILRSPTLFTNNWEDNMDFLEEYNDPIATASGFLGFSDSDSDQFALRDGFLVEMTSVDTDFAVDITTIELFDFIDTANPIEGLVINESFDSGDQSIIISQVPIPGAIWLLGSALVGLIGIRGRRLKRS